MLHAHTNKRNGKLMRYWITAAQGVDVNNLHDRGIGNLFAFTLEQCKQASKRFKRVESESPNTEFHFSPSISDKDTEIIELKADLAYLMKQKREQLVALKEIQEIFGTTDASDIKAEMNARDGEIRGLATRIAQMELDLLDAQSDHSSDMDLIGTLQEKLDEWDPKFWELKVDQLQANNESLIDHRDKIQSELDEWAQVFGTQTHKPTPSEMRDIFRRVVDDGDEARNDLAEWVKAFMSNTGDVLSVEEAHASMVSGFDILEKTVDQFSEDNDGLKMQIDQLTEKGDRYDEVNEEKERLTAEAYTTEKTYATVSQAYINAETALELMRQWKDTTVADLKQSRLETKASHEANANLAQDLIERLNTINFQVGVIKEKKEEIGRTDRAWNQPKYGRDSWERSVIFFFKSIGDFVRGFALWKGE